MNRFSKRVLSRISALLLAVTVLVGPGLLPADSSSAYAQGLPEPPAGRIGHASAWDSETGRLFVFGGLTIPARFDTRRGPEPQQLFPNDLWSYSPLEGWTLLVPAGSRSAPGGRIGHTVVWDSNARRLLVFGGVDVLRAEGSRGPAQDAFPNDLWAFSDLTGWQQVTPATNAPTPPRVVGHTAVWDTRNQRMLVFGGLSITALAQTGAFDPVSDRPSPPGAVPVAPPQQGPTTPTPVGTPAPAPPPPTRPSPTPT
ncbi:MAG: hypothetical protein HY329_21250, partial [Chloroflexi bacterium]|nr:hypothetical protein [Chloroflexota bacterium]